MSEDLWGWEEPVGDDDLHLHEEQAGTERVCAQLEAELAKCRKHGKTAVEENDRLRDDLNAQKVHTAKLDLVEAELERVRTGFSELHSRLQTTERIINALNDRLDTAKVRDTEIGTLGEPPNKLGLAERVQWLIERRDSLEAGLCEVGKSDPAEVAALREEVAHLKREQAAWSIERDFAADSTPEAIANRLRFADAARRDLKDKLGQAEAKINQLEQWHLRSAEAERGAFTMLLTLRGEGSSIFGNVDHFTELSKTESSLTPLQTKLRSELTGIIGRNPDAGEKGLAAVTGATPEQIQEALEGMPDAAPLVCTVCGSRGRSNRAHRPPGQTKGPYCSGKRITPNMPPSISETSIETGPLLSSAHIAEPAAT